jgi:anti-sigma factor ChrR (cupin superfamily)
LRERLFERIGGAAAPPFKVVRQDEGEWQAMPFPGVTVKRLHHNRGGDITMLIRLEPGAVFPGHPHKSGEHCYVLEGDVHFGDLTMGPGDYQWASGDTEHSGSYSENGCLLLMIVSEANAKLIARK